LGVHQIFLVDDAGRVHRSEELKAYLQRRREAFTNPLVYTFWGGQNMSIMIMSRALVE